MGETSSGETNFSRRDFLKVAAVGTTALAFGHGPAKFDSDPRLTVEEEKWKNNRFFENIEAFDASAFLDIRGKLLQFGDKNGELFKKNKNTSEFDIEKWTEGVKKSTQLLRRISDVHKTLRTSGELDSKADELLKRDFYDAGSVLWAVVRVDEKYKSDPEGFKNALENPIVKLTENADPFLGNEMTSIQSSWANTINRGIYSQDSRILEVIKNDGLYDLIKNPWWQDTKGPEGLPVYKKDSEIPKRPAQFSIDVENHPELKNRVLEILRSERLDRVGIDFSVVSISGESWRGAYTPIGSKDDNNDLRDIHIEIGGSITQQNIEKYKYLFESTTIHEGGHAVWELTPFMRKDADVFRNRVKIEKMLDLFRPQISSQRFFQPEGVFYSDPKEQNQPMDTAQWNRRCKTINMSTITDYPSWVYTGSYSKDLLPVHNLIDLPNYINNANPFLASISFINSELLNESKTFSEAWSVILNELKPNYEHFNVPQSLPTPNSFEKMIIEGISENISILDAPERFDYKLGLERGWFNYLNNAVIPIITTQLYLKNPQEFKSKFIDSINRKDLEPALRQHVDNTLLSVVGKRKSQTSSVFCRGDSESDAELFSEIFAYNYLRKKDGVNNEISREIWDQVDGALTQLMDDLIDSQLALVPNNNSLV